MKRSPIHKFLPLAFLSLILFSPLGATSPFGDFASKQSLSYSGTWKNTTFSSTDTYTVLITLDGYDFAITTVIEGNVYGMGISMPLTFSGTMEPDLVTTFNASFPTYGAVQATLDFTTTPATLTATSTPGSEAPSIAPSTGTATYDFLSYDATFVVNFNGGGNAVGTSSATLDEASPDIVSGSVEENISSGATATLTLNAIGSLIRFQWYVGESGDISQPITGANDYFYTTPPLTTTTKYWARVTNHVGNTADSGTITVNVAGSTRNVFNDFDAVDNGWTYSDWFGFVNIAGTPWYYSFAFNFFYTDSTDAASMWIYDLELEWIFTGRGFYPNVYYNNTDSSLASGQWLYYDTSTANPRYFFVTTGADAGKFYTADQL